MAKGRDLGGDKMSEDKKICPLTLLTYSQVPYKECLEEGCAWWVSERVTKIEKGGIIEYIKSAWNQCAIAAMVK